MRHVITWGVVALFGGLVCWGMVVSMTAYNTELEAARTACETGGNHFVEEYRSPHSCWSPDGRRVFPE